MTIVVLRELPKCTINLDDSIYNIFMFMCHAWIFIHIYKKARGAVLHFRFASRTFLRAVRTLLRYKARDICGCTAYNT